MRNPLRLALLAGAVLAGVTCTDAPTAPLAPVPAGSPGRLSLAPSFSREAAEAWQSLAAFNLVANNIHVVLRRPGPPVVVLLDTVVTIAPGQTEISLELTVPINGPEEQLGASIQVRDGTQVLFEGTGSVTAVRVGTPGTPPGGGGGNIGVTLTYVGPGASARAIRIAPRDQVIATGASIAFSVTATDASGAAIAPPPVAWTLSDATLGTIGAGDGAFVAGTKRGTVTVRAATPSAISDAVTIGIVPPATRIVTISGGGQGVSAGKAAAQPFVVEVQAADGLPVPGVTVAFSASTGASVAPASATTDAAGRASATMTVGRTAGSYTFTATAGTLGSTSVTATATPAPASAIAVVSGSGQSGAVKAAAAQPLVVLVSDEFGAPVTGASVAWAVASGGGTLSSATSVTNAEGKAQVSYTYGTTPGAATVTATVTTPAGSSSASFTLTATPGSVAALTIVSGSGQGGAPNAVLLPMVVKATDAQGNPAPNFTISWTTTAGSLSDATTTTGADGTTSVVLTLGSAAGGVVVTASAPPSGSTAGATVTFTATTRSGPATTIEKHAGDGQAAPAGSAVAVAPAVRVLDAFGNPVAGARVTFSVASGGGSVTAASATSGTNGIATAGSWTLGTTPGANTLTATVGSLSATFTATGTPTSGPPAQLIALNGPTFSYTAGVAVSTWPQVKVVDTAGVPVVGATVNVSVVDPSESTVTFSVTTDATGVAELHPATETGFSGAGTYAGTATIAAATASPVNFTITVAPGPLASLVITTVPARSVALEAPLAPQPVVRAIDANGNAIAGVPVTVSIVSGGGSFSTSSITTVTTDASGEAAFSGLAFASGSGTQLLKFTSGAVTSATADVSILASAPSVTGLAVSPSLLVTGATANWSATIGNFTASAISGVVLQGWIEQGGTRVAAGGMTPTCGAAAAGTLDAGVSCPVSFSFTMSATGLADGGATFVLEMMSGTTVVASAQLPVTVSTTPPPAGTTNTWTGAVSTDWNTAGNWSANRVPNGTDKIWIPQQAPLGLTAAGAMNYGGITLSANAIVGEIHAVAYSIGIDVQDFALEVTGAALDMGGSSITSSTGSGSVKLSGVNPLLNVYDMPPMTVMHGAQLQEGTDPWVNGNLDVLGGTFDMSGVDYFHVDGTLRIEGASAALKMAGGVETGPDVYVYGDLIAAGAASDTTLLGGALHVDGSIRQSATFSARSFAPQPSLYVSMEPAGDVRVNFASPTESKFQYLDLSPGYSHDVVRAAPRAAATPVPARLAAMRAAVARREAAMPERLRSRRATRSVRTAGALAAMVVNPGVNFETSAQIVEYLQLDVPVGVINSGTTVTVGDMFVNDQAAFDIAAGASFTVTGSCSYDDYAPEVPAGVCPNPQYHVATMEPANNLSDLFVLPNQALPADFGVRLLDNAPTPAPVAGKSVWFSISGDGDACTSTSSEPVTTDASGIARVPLSVTGRGSCVIYAYDSDESVSAELRVYAIPAPPAGGANKVFIGDGTGTWGDPNAWVDPATGSRSTPQPGDRAVVAWAGITRQQLTLSAPATAGKVWITPYASVDLNGQQLTVTDSITGGGNVHGNGSSTLVFAGTNQAIEVNSGSAALTTFGTAGCSTQSFRLAASVTTGATQLHCPLDLGANSFTATGALTTAGNGALTMSSASSVFVAGDATFGGAAGSITGGSFFFARNLSVTGTSSFVVPAAVHVLLSSADVPQAITLPDTATSNSLGSLYIQNKLGAQFVGSGSVPGNLYLYAGTTPADATKFTIKPGASLTVGTQADVNQNALLTIDGTLTVPTLSIGTSGAVVVNGVLSVQNCPQSSQVSGTGLRGACAPPQ